MLRGARTARVHGTEGFIKAPRCASNEMILSGRSRLPCTVLTCGSNSYCPTERWTTSGCLAYSLRGFLDLRETGDTCICPRSRCQLGRFVSSHAMRVVAVLRYTASFSLFIKAEPMVPNFHGSRPGSPWRKLILVCSLLALGALEASGADAAVTYLRLAARPSLAGAANQHPFVVQVDQVVQGIMPCYAIIERGMSHDLSVSTSGGFNFLYRVATDTAGAITVTELPPGHCGLERAAFVRDSAQSDSVTFASLDLYRVEGTPCRQAPVWGGPDGKLLIQFASVPTGASFYYPSGSSFLTGRTPSTVSVPFFVGAPVTVVFKADGYRDATVVMNFAYEGHAKVLKVLGRTYPLNLATAVGTPPIDISATLAREPGR